MTEPLQHDRFRDNSFDAIHYDAQEQRELEKHYYDAYKLLTKKTE